ncbi:MAG: hypothetical protein COT34_00735 [Candidatus Nealsonbacteria bacterium CG08_land_8_20_14_0_20_43_11]|uniref:Nucleotidyl transferase domain-containing protein n=1 Tax=Candidatus Nealsonbacteria bacterium CG08_land_8_20_14_0_20_43_11 TaxID=1974706 RepID=A0A2M6T0Z8_9BACT|nr:MAG: hypothetical protein COT34_00735 [Candidatus Nealsonbacteria bacterium CG08_land_8_20_14_0_20_43_11]
MKKENLANYKAVILAGGKGTRLYPVTKEIPKPLLTIHRKPIISYLVDLFFSQGVREITVSISRDFREEFDWWKKRYHPEKNIKFLEEEKPLGTLGGLWLLKDQLKDSPFFFTNGDELKEVRLDKMAEFHQQISAVGTIALVKVPNPQDYGVVLCSKGFVKEFLEKPQNPPSHFISSGLYLFNPEVFKYLSGPDFSMIEKDLFPILAKEKKLAGFKFEGKWMDCGDWKRYEKAINSWPNLT